jgi:hypothetical protein
VSLRTALHYCKARPAVKLARPPGHGALLRDPSIHVRPARRRRQLEQFPLALLEVQLQGEITFEGLVARHAWGFAYLFARLSIVGATVSLGNPIAALQLHWSNPNIGPSS